MNKMRNHSRMAFVLAIVCLLSQPSMAQDDFEPDDTSETASWIGLHGPSQDHDFHDAGDEDWARFFVESPNICTIDARQLGNYADTVITLYRETGMEQVEEVDDVEVIDYTIV